MKSLVGTGGLGSGALSFWNGNGPDLPFSPLKAPVEDAVLTIQTAMINTPPFWQLRSVHTNCGLYFVARFDFTVFSSTYSVYLKAFMVYLSSIICMLMYDINPLRSKF